MSATREVVDWIRTIAYAATIGALLGLAARNCGQL